MNFRFGSCTITEDGNITEKCSIEHILSLVPSLLSLWMKKTDKKDDERNREVTVHQTNGHFAIQPANHNLNIASASSPKPKPPQESFGKLKSPFFSNLIFLINLYIWPGFLIRLPWPVSGKPDPFLSYEFERKNFHFICKVCTFFSILFIWNSIQKCFFICSNRIYMSPFCPQSSWIIVIARIWVAIYLILEIEQMGNRSEFHCELYHLLKIR